MRNPNSSLFSWMRGSIFGLLRQGFRLLPLSMAKRDAMRQSFLRRFPDIRPMRVRPLTSLAASSRKRVHAGEVAVGHFDREEVTLPDPLPARLIAFYLPQFHRIPENDAWWGKGFTEWRNVARALPQFEGHVQPRLPGGLGFYDLQNPHVLHEQAELAKHYGIGGFCMYFYWFGGTTLLESPARQWLHDESIDMPICLCWANEDWTRTWDGRSKDVLISQSHSEDDDIAFISHISKYLNDQRYLRIEGKPLVVIYRPGLLPNAKASANRWRSWCKANGIGDICLGYVQSFERPHPQDIGFDVAIEFPPNLSTPTDITGQQELLNPEYQGEVLDWRDVSTEYRDRPAPQYRTFFSVNCGWDNEPRRPGRGRTYVNAHPYEYGAWLRDTIETRLSKTRSEDRVVFINAWNEWAEGAILEPDARFGHRLLHETRSALCRTYQEEQRPLVVIHAWYPDEFGRILQALMKLRTDMEIVVTTPHEKREHMASIALRNNANVEFACFENRGRDILPFLEILHRRFSEGDRILLKLHTKRSPHLANGSQWLSSLLDSLASVDRWTSIVKAFAADPTLGIVGAEASIQKVDKFIGSNSAPIEHLMQALRLDGPLNNTHLFVAGSMFWTRTHALRPFIDASLNRNDFEPELGQIDGTLAHAIERLFALTAMASGYRLASADRPHSNPKDAMHFPYARLE